MVGATNLKHSWVALDTSILLSDGTHKASTTHNVPISMVVQLHCFQDRSFFEASSFLNSSLILAGLPMLPTFVTNHKASQADLVECLQTVEALHSHKPRWLSPSTVKTLTLGSTFRKTSWFLKPTSAPLHPLEAALQKGSHALVTHVVVFAWLTRLKQYMKALEHGRHLYFLPESLYKPRDWSALCPCTIMVPGQRSDRWGLSGMDFNVLD